MGGRSRTATGIAVGARLGRLLMAVLLAALGVLASAPAQAAPVEGDLRLRAGGSDQEGRLEVYYDDKWGIVCDDYFGLEDAKVACKQMGFTDAEDFIRRFGSPSARVWLDDLRCDGSEARLSDCTHRGWGQHNCSLREAVGVRCTAQGVLLNVSSLTVVEESTTGAGYTVRLGRVPTGNVTVTPVAPSGSDLSFSPTSLTFSTQDYNLAKTVTVTAAADADKTDDTDTLTHTVSGGGYDSATAPSVTVTVTDNDAPGVEITPNRLTIDEGDSTGKTYTVVLAALPTGNVTVTATVPGGSDVSVSPTSLTFTTMNWNSARTVTVTAAEDADEVADQVTLTHGASGGGYGSLPSIDSVAVRVLDNDIEVKANPRTIALDEGQSATYTLKPRGTAWSRMSVSVVAPSGLTVSPSEATFTQSDWDRAQTITVTALHDADRTNDSATITHSVEGSSTIPADSVSVAIRDDDGPPDAWIDDGGAINLVEGGSDSYSMWLRSDPRGTATVTVTAPSGLTVSPTSLTFNSSNWGQARTITVQSLQEDNDTTDEIFHVTHTITLDAITASLDRTRVLVADDDNGEALVGPRPSNALWWAALTARRGAQSVGHIDYTGPVDVGKLSDEDFTFGGVTREIDAVFVDDRGAFQLWVDSGNGSQLPNGMVLHVGSLSMTLGSASRQSFGTTHSDGTFTAKSEHTYWWWSGSHSVSLSDRDVVAVWLEQPVDTSGLPNTLGAPEATSMDGGARLRWDAPAEIPSKPVIHYEYQHEGEDGWKRTTATETTKDVMGLNNGQTYKFRLRAVNSEGKGPASAPSAPVTPSVNTAPAGLPTITGTARVGETLTASASGITDDDGLTNATFTWQWVANDGTTDSDISGATGSTYALTASEAGKTIKVRVTFTDDRGTEETLVSAATAAVSSGLTAEFQQVPESHDGSSDFTFRVAFSEAVVTGFVRMRDEAFTVTGGSVTSAKRVERRSDLWNIHIEPDGNGAVTVNLPATTGECTATGAICTSGGLKLSGSVSAEIAGSPLTPLTASFSEVPAEHDGSSAFTLKLTFSEEPDGIGFRTVRDNLFTATGGTVVRAKRTGEDSNLEFRLTVEPSGNGAVTLALATPLPACGQSGAVCTADGRALTGPVTATVQGPPALSVLDAEVEEGPNAALAFAVSLGRAATGTVTVDYAASDGTAVAGQDYTAAAGTLSFAAGETEKTVSVTVLDDVHDDPGETLTLTLSNATGAWIEDGTATGTIRNSDAMPRAWLARFGRTVADQVIEAVEGRMTAARRPGAEVSVGGQKIGGGAAADDLESREAAAKLKGLAGWLRGEDGGGKAGSTLGFRPVTARDLMTGSSFELTGGTAEGGFSAVWGRGAVTRFDGGEGELTLDGEVASGMVGVDFTRGRGMAGLAVAHSRGEGGYQSPIRNGEVESSLTGLYPWGRYAVSERLTVWGMAGYGSGTLTLTPEGMPAMETDMDLAMGAVGGRGVLVKAAAEGGLELAAKTDALLVRTTSDEVDGSAATLASEADVTRVRLGLEGTWRGIGTGGGGSLVPTLEVGVRQDGGDAETGGGMDIGAGLSWTQPSLGIRAEVSGRALLTHTEEGFRERGFAGALAWDPTPDSERGPSLTLSQTMGARTSGGMEALLRPETALVAANDGGDDLGQRRLEVKLGYGFALSGEDWTGTPEVGFGWSGTVRETTLGWRLAGARRTGLAFGLDVEGARRETLSGSVEPEHRIGVSLTARW